MAPRKLPNRAGRDKRRTAFEAEIAQRAEQRATRQRSQRDAAQRLQRPLFENLRKDGLTDIRRESARLLKKRRSAAKPKTPRPPKPAATHEPGTRLGSVVQTWTPPFDFDWTPMSQSGGATVTSSADRTTGAISYDAITANNDASNADVWAGVGVFWQIPDWLSQASGTLTVSASVSFSFFWDDQCAYASCHSDGSLFLNVDIFEDDGGDWDGLVINQQSALWSDDSWWRGGSNSGSNNAFHMSAATPVDNTHFYNLWVFLNGNVTADGDGSDFWDFWWSDAFATASATVQSITASFH